MSQLQDYKTSFPRWSGEGLKKAVPQLDENGLDLLEVDDSCLKLYIIITQTCHELQTVVALGLPFVVTA